jgi:signal transduction histidine kinase
VGRELVLNVAKHAQARRLAILVSARDGGIDLVVEDDGVGLPADPVPQHGSGRGLRGLSELVARAGGQTERTRGPEGGSRVAVWLPA